MKFEFKPSFERSIKHFDSHRKEGIKNAVCATIDFFETNVKPKGLGLKHLKREYWEIRATIKDRVVFRFHGNLVEFIIAGSHNEIKKFLKHV